MKKFLFVMLAVMCASVMYGQKRVAVVTPTATECVDPIDIDIVRGNLEQYISAMRGYEAFTRADIDQVVDQVIIEMDLKRSGMINEANMKKLGALEGVDIILVSNLTYGRGRLNVTAKFIDMETGKMGNAVSQVMNPAVPEDMEAACKELAEKLTGVSSASNNISAENSDIFSTNKEGKKITFSCDFAHYHRVEVNVFLDDKTIYTGEVKGGFTITTEDYNPGNHILKIVANAYNIMNANYNYSNKLAGVKVNMKAGDEIFVGNVGETFKINTLEEDVYEFDINIWTNKLKLKKDKKSSSRSSTKTSKSTKASK